VDECKPLVTGAVLTVSDTITSMKSPSPPPTPPTAAPLSSESAGGSVSYNIDLGTFGAIAGLSAGAYTRPLLSST